MWVWLSLEGPTRTHTFGHQNTHTRVSEALSNSDKWLQMNCSLKSHHYARHCASGCRSLTSPAFQLLWSVGPSKADLLSKALSLKPDRDHLFTMPYNLFSQVVKSLFTLIWCCALMYYPASVPCIMLGHTFIHIWGRNALQVVMCVCNGARKTCAQFDSNLWKPCYMPIFHLCKLYMGWEQQLTNTTCGYGM